MKKLASLLLLLGSCAASAGLPVTITLTYKVSACIARGGTWLALPPRRVGTVWIADGICTLPQPKSP